MENSTKAIGVAAIVAAYLYWKNKENAIITVTDNSENSSSTLPLLGGLPPMPETNEPTQVFGGALPSGMSVILPNPVDIVIKPVILPVTPIPPSNPIVKGYTWAGTGGATHAIACSQGAGKTLYSVDATMVAGQTVYTNSAGTAVFNGGNTYWKKYAGGNPYQVMMINNVGVVSDVRGC
jgi:hypothetical protein